MTNPENLPELHLEQKTQYLTEVLDRWLEHYAEWDGDPAEDEQTIAELSLPIDSGVLSGHNIFVSDPNDAANLRISRYQCISSKLSHYEVSVWSLPKTNQEMLSAGCYEMQHICVSIVCEDAAIQSSINGKELFANESGQSVFKEFEVSNSEDRIDVLLRYLEGAGRLAN